MAEAKKTLRIIQVKSSIGYKKDQLATLRSLGLGKIVLNTFNILDNVDRHPAADGLLMNIIADAAGSVAEPLPRERADVDAALEEIGF